MIEDRFEKIRQLANRINDLCSAWYATPRSEMELKQFWEKVDYLQEAMAKYLQCENVWDSQLIEVAGCVGTTRFKTKAFSCTDSVMDRARDLYVFLAVPS